MKQKDSIFTTPPQGTITSKKEFCDLFGTHFEASGLTLEEAANLFDTATGTISRWMFGHTAPASASWNYIITTLKGLKGTGGKVRK